MEDTFLASVQQDEDFNFDSLVEKDKEETETPKDSPTEQNQEKESPSQEGEEESEAPKPVEGSEDTPDEDKIPFHKHPRWQEMLNENRSLKEKLSEVSDNVSKGFETIKNDFKSNQPQKPPMEFAELTGLDVNDPNTALAWAKFQALMPSYNKEELKKELFAEWQAQSQQKDQAQKQIIEWSRGEMKKLRDSGKTFDDNKLLKVIEDFSPVDQNGYTDFNKAYQIYELKEKAKQEKKQEVIKGKKQLSSRVNASGMEVAKKDFISPEDIEGRDWRELI